MIGDELPDNMAKIGGALGSVPMPSGLTTRASKGDRIRDSKEVLRSVSPASWKSSRVTLGRTFGLSGTALGSAGEAVGVNGPELLFDVRSRWRLLGSGDAAATTQFLSTFSM